MSRIGNRIINVPEGVTVTETDGVVEVKGPKGTLSENTNFNLQSFNKIKVETIEVAANVIGNSEVIKYFFSFFKLTLI